MRVALLAVLALSLSLVAGPAFADGSAERGATAAGAVGGAAHLGPVQAADLARVQAWAQRAAKRVDVPERALQAYGAAEVRINREQPGCRLGWNALAGIGLIESGHGTGGGRTLLADGTSDRPVVGPVLDGGGFAAIRPTKLFTRLHGDRQWDHALGPMQFIGTTWKRWAADGDHDGVKNPLDIDDAALATARYLCASGRPLTRDSWNAAVLSYNHDVFYLSHVFDAALAYARAVPGSATYFRG